MNEPSGPPVSTLLEDELFLAIHGRDGVAVDRGGGGGRHCWHPDPNGPNATDLTEEIGAFCCWCDLTEVVVPAVKVPRKRHGPHYRGPNDELEWCSEAFPAGPCPGRRA